MSTSLHHSRGPGALQPALDESTSATEVSGNVEFADGAIRNKPQPGDRSNFVPLRSERERPESLHPLNSRISSRPTRPS